MNLVRMGGSHVSDAFQIEKRKFKNCDDDDRDALQASKRGNREESK